MTAGHLTEVVPARWDAVLEEAAVRDAYYAQGFVAASAALAGAQPVLLHLRGDAGDVVFAALVREDPVDVVTPYGYGGPVGTGEDPPWDAFGAAYDRWCAERGAVSTFVVHHPLYRTHEHAGALGLHDARLAGTVAWPLAGADLLAGMHRHHRRLVRRALREGFTAEVRRAPEDLSGFVALYEQTMRRRGAAPFYFFPETYWDALATGVPLIEVDVRDPAGTVVAAVLGMGEPPWLHYHLGAAADAARGTGASHLALLRLAEWGGDAGFGVLHLGGGVGGRADPLLEYKRRFAPEGLVEAHLGKAVHDPAAYAVLTGFDEIDWAGFFPAYRAPR